MLQMTLQQAATILGLNTTEQSSTLFSGISIDTRTLTPGNLFVAIHGERVDGHAFLAQAAQQGASAALVETRVDSTLPQLVVPDVVAALGQLSAHWRQQFQLPVIAVTGSNGKTTVKNMIAAIMTAACHDDANHVLATQGTLNNHLGLPLTLSRLTAEHQYAVIEMGMNHFGEIAYLTHLTRPDVAVITNAGPSHLEGVGDLAGVARAKGEIFEGLAAKGIAILNRDDAFFDYWQQLIPDHRYITFGQHAEANVRCSTVQGQHYLHTPVGDIAVRLPLLGAHNLLNMQAAAAACIAINIDLIAIKQGLEALKAAPGRMQVHRLANDVVIIDDTYNANPLSLTAAIDALNDFAGKKILVLADMKELGPEAKTIHLEMGDKIRDAGIDYLFTYGELSAHTAQRFGDGAYHFNEQHKLLNALKPFLYNPTTILIKGSRSMHMEKVVQGLTTETLPGTANTREHRVC